MDAKLKMMLVILVINFKQYGAFQADSGDLKVLQQRLRRLSEQGVLKPAKRFFTGIKFRGNTQDAYQNQLHGFNISDNINTNNIVPALLNSMGSNSPDLKCTPGRTVLRVEKKQIPQPIDPASDEFMRRNLRRNPSSVRGGIEDYDGEKCSVCMCSVDGTLEDCVQRPVDSLNECMRMKVIMEKREKNVPYELTDTLAYRIRRVGGGVVASQGPPATCVPSVSKYSDCTEANKCNGCTKCVCSADGTWSCKSVQVCDDEESDYIDDKTFDAAIAKLDMEVKNQKKWVKDVMDQTKIGLQNWHLSKLNRADITGRGDEPKTVKHSLEGNNKSGNVKGYVIAIPRNQL